MKKNYQVIYLNGPSSVGKTTLARGLQNKLEQPFLVLGIDQIVYMMPEKYNDFNGETNSLGFSFVPVKDIKANKTVYELKIGSYGQKMVQAFKDIVMALLCSGNNVIIDDVSFGKAQVNAWRNALKDFNVIWVGITAPIEVIEKRERERGDRKVGSARWQAERVHKDVNYDIIIDTYNKGLKENVEIIFKLIE